ncbi:MAG: helix-turn-helix domain-containing protein [Candidatus Thermoplasmatota archaeon]|nr:helix-turn-helix domain-containing protein [Candidatus Thermoplasmatota archaeon]
MPEPPMILTPDNLKEIESSIVTSEGMGARIRQILGEYHGGDFDVAWEVDAAVEALDVFTSRWTIEILATLYIAGDRRFNELRKLLVGISSRTLSDKLRKCTENGLLDRIVMDGPPIRVTYRLTDHGQRAGRLLGPLVAYMKLHKGSVQQE